MSVREGVKETVGLKEPEVDILKDNRRLRIEDSPI